MISLRLKMLALMTGTVGVSVFLTTAAAVRSQLIAGYAGLEREACNRATVAGIELAEPLTSGDPETIREALEAQLVGLGAVRATVLDAGGSARLAAEAGGEPELSTTTWAGPIAQQIIGAIAWTTLTPHVVVPVTGATGGIVAQVRFDLDTSPAVRDAMRSASDAITVGTAVVTLSVVLAFAGIGRITVPLDRLRDAASAVTQGDLSARLNAEGEREVDELCQSFNTMADILATQSSTARFLTGVMDSMADSLVVVDTQARVLRVNAALTELLGYSEDELKGRTASLFCEADGVALTAAQLESFLGKGAKEDHEVTFIAKDGRRIPISFSGSPIRDEQGQITGYVCIGTDISARRAAEFERERMHKQLLISSREAGMAVVATGVLHNVGNVLNSVNVSASMVESGLKRSKVPTLLELAGLIQQNKGDLAGFMTTDERGRIIPDYLGRLAQHMAAEQERMLSEISALTRHVGHIKDIISVQQATAAAGGLVEPVDLRAAVEDAILVITPSATRHQAQVVREFADDVPMVTTDRHKVLQIVVNLLTNAIDAVKEVAAIRAGRIVVGLRADAAPDGSARVRLDVTDNGVGIAPENLTRIFAHGFTTKKGGHGFGLHSSALAAAELKGSLTVHSEGPRTGATFTLSLPISAAASTEKTVETSKAAA